MLHATSLKTVEPISDYGLAVKR